MNQLVENLKLKAWRQASAEIGAVFENAVANRAEDLLIELIVKECINKIEEISNRHTDQYIDATLRDIAFEIETHFGIN